MSEGVKHISITSENRKLTQRVRELEIDLRRLRVVMRDAALEAADIQEFIVSGMTQRAVSYAGSLQRKLDVERSSGPSI